MKNNVTRYLDQRKIDYETFELPAEKLGAEATARLLDQPLDSIYKTIVVKRAGKGRPILAVVPGTSEVDLKALAKVLGEKKVFLTTQNEAESLTGLQVGGISPLALINRGFQVVIDSSVQEHDRIHVSGGERGLNIRLPVVDLIKITRASAAGISCPSF
jgi:Cys-tRNA(Pro)/Cys-tRNA(Cys) deacylase